MSRVVFAFRLGRTLCRCVDNKGTGDCFIVATKFALRTGVGIAICTHMRVPFPVATYAGAWITTKTGSRKSPKFPVAPSYAGAWIATDAYDRIVVPLKRSHPTQVRG